MATDDWKRSCGEEAKQAFEIVAKNGEETSEQDQLDAKYSAREIWERLEKRLDDLGEEQKTLARNELDAALGAVKFFLACNFIETDETSRGEAKLDEAWLLAKERKCDVETACLSMRILNQMGLLNAGRGDNETAMRYLREADQLFKECVAAGKVAPFALRDLVLPVEEWASDDARQKEFEAEQMLALFYLAQVYGNLDRRDESADCLKETLQRQLTTKQCNAKEWALNCATLSNYYIGIGNYPVARHCLASADKVLTSLLSDSDDDDGSIAKSKADISRCWITYCLDLLRRSASFSERIDDLPHSPSNHLFDLDVSEYESRVPACSARTFDAARTLYLAASHHVESAKSFYVLDGHVSDHVDIVQQHSQLFKVLASFESDRDRQCKMHKRRIDMLEELVGRLNRQFYLQLCRQMLFELAEAYNSMVDLKISIAGGDTSPSPSSQRAMQKINRLIKKAIGQFDEFVESYRDHKKEFPAAFDDVSLRPVLTAKFCMARLWTKFVVGETARRVENTSKALGLYKEIVDYKRNHPDMPDVFAEEMSVCEEMITLLPIKLAKLTTYSTAN